MFGEIFLDIIFRQFKYKYVSTYCRNLLYKYSKYANLKLLLDA